MDISKLKVKELEALFASGDVTDELLEACRQDKRAAAGRLIRKWERQKAEEARLMEMFRYEHEAMDRGLEIVAGADEAGRGPLAGPVSVAAVILPKDLILPHLNDSKKLSAAVRDKLYDEIMEKAVCVRHAFIDEQTIDKINILQATIKGMYKTIFNLAPEPQMVLVDALELPELPMYSQALIKGDSKSASIAAASIIAKVKRDRLMDEYDKKYPEYGFAAHKGYGTAQHIEALRKYGPCPIHRLSFEPVKSIAQSFNPFL